MNYEKSIYPYKVKCFRQEQDRLAKAKISERNRQLIYEFQNHLFAKGSKELRVSKVTSHLRRICEVMEIDFDKAHEKDIQLVVGHFNRNVNYAEATKADYRRSLKQFYFWYKDYDERFYTDNRMEQVMIQRFYKYIEHLKSTCKIKDIDYSNILTEDDADTVIERGCYHVMHKAFIATLHETGCRAGEILNARIRDFQIIKGKHLLTVNGKTGERTIPIVRCVVYLTQWIDTHPYRDDDNSFIWVGENTRYKRKGIKKKEALEQGIPMYTRLLHKGADKLVDRCFKRAGVNKKHNMHWFRHSRATILAAKIPTTLLCKYMGWTLDSKQVRRYVHLADNQLDNAILGMYGLNAEEDDKGKPVVCRCKTLNKPNAKYCMRCGAPLSLDIALNDEDLLHSQIAETIKQMMIEMKNPNFMKEFEEFKKERKYRQRK